MQQRRSQVAIFHFFTDFSTRSRLSVQVQSISNQALRISVNGDSTNTCTYAQICTGCAQLQCHLVVLFEGADHEVDREIRLTVDSWRCKPGIHGEPSKSSNFNTLNCLSLSFVLTSKSQCVPIIYFLHLSASFCTANVLLQK